MKTKSTIIYMVIALIAVTISMARPASASDEEKVMKVVTDFTKALNTLDYKLMSSIWRHSPETSSFEPTDGYPFLYQGWDETANWWKDLETTETVTNVQTLHHPQVTMLTKDVAVTTTYCNNVYTDPETKAQTVALIRQTLVVQKIDGKWLIVHHHASAFPVE